MPTGPATRSPALPSKSRAKATSVLDVRLKSLITSLERAYEKREDRSFDENIAELRSLLQCRRSPRPSVANRKSVSKSSAAGGTKGADTTKTSLPAPPTTRGHSKTKSKKGK